MTKRLFQVILLSATLIGTAGQLLACTLRAGGDCCCAAARQATHSLVDAAQHSMSESASSCGCRAAPTNGEKPPAESRDPQQGKIALLNAGEQALSLFTPDVAPAPSLSRTPVGHSPPYFILFHSLLI